MTEEEMETYEYDWEQAGCYGWASKRGLPRHGRSRLRFEPLFDAMNAMYKSRCLPPDLKTLQSEWSACMADAGTPTSRLPKTR